MAVLPRPVIMMIWSQPAAIASSTPYWMMGLSTRGSISFGCALVAGRNRVPSPAAGKTALRTLAGMSQWRAEKRASIPAWRPISSVRNPRIVFRKLVWYVYVSGTTSSMAYVIAEPCIGTKDTACVDACPVDCIHPKKDEPAYATEEMLYIDPVECIDCGACVPVCPVSAIFALDDLPEKWKAFTERNAAYYGR